MSKLINKLLFYVSTKIFHFVKIFLNKNLCISYTSANLIENNELIKHTTNAKKKVAIIIREGEDIRENKINKALNTFAILKSKKRKTNRKCTDSETNSVSSSLL